MKHIAAIFALMLILAGSASAFNGNRSGFVLGGGIGFAPIAKWTVEEPGEDFDEQKSGIAFQFLIGHCWDGRNMIVYEGNFAGFNSEVGDQTIGQGFHGGSWYHYFGPTGRTWFTAIGLGLYSFDPEDFDANDWGLGIQFGGGYEFGRHVQVGGYLSFGNTNDPYVDIEFEHVTMNVLFTAVAF